MSGNGNGNGRGLVNEQEKAALQRGARPGLPPSGIVDPDGRSTTMSCRFAPLFAVVLMTICCSAGQAVAADAPEGRTALLRAMAEGPGDTAPPGRPARLRQVHPGERLFYFTGGDNAAAVRAVADVTGDGKDEIIVGFDIFHSGDNLYCLDGSSTGLATVVWSLETLDGASGGYFWGDQCLEPASDADGTGYKNILAGTAGGGRTAYSFDSLDGSIHWRYDTYLSLDSGWVYSLAELNDASGDLTPDVAFGVGSDNDTVTMVSGAPNGGLQATPLWQFPAGDATFSVRNIGDVNDDDVHDVLAAVGEDIDRVVCLDGGSDNITGHVLWQHTPGESVYACGVLRDITGDGVNEALAVLWTADGSAIRCLNGATGTQEWASTQVFANGMAVDPLQDVTGDGHDEVIVSSWDNAVTVLDGSDGSVLWSTPTGTLNNGYVWTARAIEDLDGDGREEVIAGSFDTFVYALDGDDGEVFWAYDTNERVFSVYPVGDLNDDGRADVAVGTQDHNSSVVVQVLSGGAGMPPIDPPLFSDGFESGDTTVWATVVGGG
jgi:outer membrane protein assembly factor BamB